MHNLLDKKNIKYYLIIEYKTLIKDTFQEFLFMGKNGMRMFRFTPSMKQTNKQI